MDLRNVVSRLSWEVCRYKSETKISNSQTVTEAMTRENVEKRAVDIHARVVVSFKNCQKGRNFVKCFETVRGEMKCSFDYLLSVWLSWIATP